jgi:hypothetical protein
MRGRIIPLLHISTENHTQFNCSVRDSDIEVSDAPSSRTARWFPISSVLDLVGCHAYPERLPVVVVIGGGLGGPLGGPLGGGMSGIGSSRNLTMLGEQLAWQSQLNKYAAICAAVAAFSLSFSLTFSPSLHLRGRWRLW